MSAKALSPSSLSSSSSSNNLKMSSSKQQKSSLFNLSSKNIIQTNSPTDSAIGTISDSLQSPPLFNNNNNILNSQKRPPIPLPRIIPLLSPSTLNYEYNNNNQMPPPRPPKKSKNGQNILNKRRIGLSVPILDKIVCEKDFEKIIKETEIFSSKPEISQKEIIEKSKLSRECLQEENKEILLENGIIENKRYYLFDSLRHEYRLYYAREVRLQSETNLTKIGLDENKKEMEKKEKLLENKNKELAKQQRRHSFGTAAARIRRPIPPTNKIQTSMNELINQQIINNNLIQNNNNNNEEILFQPLPQRWNSFERNNNLRKSDIPKRNNNSKIFGGAKRSVILKQQRLKINNNNNQKEENQKISENSFSSSPSLHLTNQIIKDLLKPLNSPKNESELELKNNNNNSFVYDDKNNIEKPLISMASEIIKEENNNIEQSKQNFLQLQKSSKTQTDNFSKNRRKISKENKYIHKSKKWTRFQYFLAILLVFLLFISFVTAFLIIIVIYNL